MRLGVDFGTTYTVVACADRGNYPVLSFTDNAGDTHEWFPSVVAEAGGKLRFGFDALARTHEASVLYSFKRLLSSPTALPDTQVRLGRVTLSLETLVASYLHALREAILTRSNLPDVERPGWLDEPMTATIAVPAHAHGAQRLMTLDAFRSAGFAPLAMLNEPSAAGFEFTHRHRNLINSKRNLVVVYDLGGGTFDASLVRIRATHHEVLATAGLNDLGGSDFDEVLLRLVLSQTGVREQDLSAYQRQRLAEQCREAKERLNPSSRKLSIDIETAIGKSSRTLPRPLPTEVTIPVATFYEACTPLIERSLQAMRPVMSRFDSELNGLETHTDLTSQVAGVYVVGGASSLPLVPRLLRSQYGRRVHKSPYPSAAVAIGLAIAADDDSGFELSDRFAHTFGVFREGAAGHEITFDPIFTHDTPLPARRGASISCRRMYRAAHNVGHFRFLECSAISEGRPAGDVVPSGDVLFPFDSSLRGREQDLAEIPVRRTAESGPRIEEEYTLDEHGMVALTIRNLDEDYQRVYRVGTNIAASP